jgi:hypothetical protein
MTSPQFDPVSASVKRSLRRPAQKPHGRDDRGRDRDERETRRGLCAFGSERVGERPSARRDAPTWRRFCRRPKDGKAATPRPGPPPDITLLSGRSPTPRRGKQSRRARSLPATARGSLLTQQAPCREPRSLSQFQQSTTPAWEFQQSTTPAWEFQQSTTPAWE